jgi:hypothetical protein
MELDQGSVLQEGRASRRSSTKEEKDNCKETNKDNQEG